MKNAHQNRQDFINSYRREMGWSGIAVALGALCFVLIPMFLKPSMLEIVGALILAPTMAYAAFKSLRIYRSSDGDVLRAAGERHLGLFALVGLGMVVFGLGTGGLFNALYMTAILIAIVPGELNRVRQAKRYEAEMA